jgi:hypothetical protein
VVNTGYVMHIQDKPKGVGMIRAEIGLKKIEKL